MLRKPGRPRKIKASDDSVGKGIMDDGATSGEKNEEFNTASKKQGRPKKINVSKNSLSTEVGIQGRRPKKFEEVGKFAENKIISQNSTLDRDLQLNSNSTERIQKEDARSTLSRKQGGKKNIDAIAEFSESEINSQNNILDSDFQLNADRQLQNQKEEAKRLRKPGRPKKTTEESEVRQIISENGVLDSDTQLNTEEKDQIEKRDVTIKQGGPKKLEEIEDFDVSHIISKNDVVNSDLQLSVDKTENIQKHEVNAPPRKRAGRPKKIKAGDESALGHIIPQNSTMEKELQSNAVKVVEIENTGDNPIPIKIDPSEFGVNLETVDKNISQLERPNLTNSFYENKEENLPAKRIRRKKIKSIEDSSKIQNIIASSGCNDTELLNITNKKQKTKRKKNQIPKDQKKEVNVKKPAASKEKKKLKSSSTEFTLKPAYSSTYEEMADIWKSIDSDSGKSSEEESHKKNKHFDKRVSPNNFGRVRKTSSNKTVRDGSDTKSYKKYRSKIKYVNHDRSTDSEKNLDSQNKTEFGPGVSNGSNSNVVKENFLKTDSINMEGIGEASEGEKRIINEMEVPSQLKQELQEPKKIENSEIENKENSDRINVENSFQGISASEEEEDDKGTGHRSDETDSDWRDLFADGSTAYEGEESTSDEEHGRERTRSEPDKPALPKDISRLDLRVGLITQVVEHVLSRRYWIPYIRIGNEKERNSITNLRPQYERRPLKGKQVVVVCNIRDTVKKLDADCLILYAKSGETHELLEAPEDCQDGDRISVEGFPFTPDPKHRFIHPMKEGKLVFREVVRDLRVDGEGRAEYRGIPLMTAKGGFLMAKTLRNSPIHK